MKTADAYPTTRAFAELDDEIANLEKLLDKATSIIGELAEDRGNYIIHCNRDLVLKARDWIAAERKP